MPPPTSIGPSDLGASGPARATPKLNDQYNKITWLGYSVEFPLNLQEIQL